MSNRFNHTLHKLRLRHFELLDFLSSEGTVRGAARKMALTQPAVSKMLREIEDCYGSALFERSASGVRPNQLGLHLTRNVIVLLNEMRAVSDEISAIADGASSVLRVGTVSVIPRVPRAIAQLRVQMPQVRVMVREGTVLDLTKQLLEGELDCIVGALPPEILAKSSASLLKIEALSNDKLCVVASSAHVLAKKTGKNKILSWAKLNEFEWVLPPPSSLLRRAMVDVYLHSGLAPPEPSVELLSPLSMGDLLALDKTLIGVMRYEQAYAEQTSKRLCILDVRPDVRLPSIAFMTRRQSTEIEEDLKAFRAALGKLDVKLTATGGTTRI